MSFTGTGGAGGGGGGGGLAARWPLLSGAFWRRRSSRQTPATPLGALTPGSSPTTEDAVNGARLGGTEASMPPRVGAGDVPGGAVAGPAAASSAGTTAAKAAGASIVTGTVSRAPSALTFAPMALRRLPAELWLHIFGFLDTRTLALYCSTVSRYWSALVLEAIKDREYAQHETFMLTHSRVNVGAHRFCRDVNALLDVDDVPIVVTADSGGGKSSMLTQWILEYAQASAARAPVGKGQTEGGGGREEQQARCAGDAHLAAQANALRWGPNVDGSYHRTRANALVLYHFVGSPAHSTDYMNVLHRFMSEIKQQCSIAEDVPSTSINLQKKFPQVGGLRARGARRSHGTGRPTTRTLGLTVRSFAKPRERFRHRSGWPTPRDTFRAA